MKFIAAQTVEQAVARIYSLTGARPRQSRGEKQAILALRNALGIEIETTRTNAAMAQKLAATLEVEWDPRFTDLNRVSLDGLNALLQGAAAAYERGELRTLEGDRPSDLQGQEWASFNAAQSKIEAVNRISALTESGPEWLGPGSKEHKSVLINLAVQLAPSVDISLSKTDLGRALAHEFSVPWSDACISTGYTISLIGLNMLLAGAERKLGRLGVERSQLFGTPEEEGTALAAALLDAWRADAHPLGGRRVVWDARRSIRWMQENGITDGPNQNEWQGFYWEAAGRSILNRAFKPNPTPPQMRYGNTVFDYSLRFVWDLKAHTDWWRNADSDLVLKRGTADAPLNDQQAMDSCVAEQGLGFLIVSGIAVADSDRSFFSWHREFKARAGVVSRSSNSGTSRLRKQAFEPQSIEAYFFRSEAGLNAAKASGCLLGFNQGKQAPVNGVSAGASRRPKYNMNISKARSSEFHVAHGAWTIPESAGLR